MEPGWAFQLSLLVSPTAQWADAYMRAPVRRQANQVNLANQVKQVNQENQLNLGESGETGESGESGELGETDESGDSGQVLSHKHLQAIALANKK